MLESLVAWVLNNYVGEYFENLNTDQLSIALLQGQVELENVPLKKTALRKFDIPVQVKSGVIGKLTLSIPMHMRSEPWVLKMSDLLVLLGPSTSKYDVEFVEQYEQSRKDQALDALEQHHKKQLLTTLGQEVKDDDVEQNQWWGASLVSAITNNMQVILNNIHIRYEDDTIPGHTFNFGIRIENLTIQTTNSQWRPGFIQSTVIGPDGKPSNVFKKLDIRRLSVYWNCSAGGQVISDDILTPTTAHVSEFKKRMSPENTKNNTFILQQPFSMEVRMEKNSSKFPLKTVPPTPRFKFDLRPERIEVELSKRQIAQMRLLAREWARFDRARQHRKWRPLASVKESPKSWWKFAIDRTRDEWRRYCSSLSTEETLRRAKHLNAYCRAYKRKLAGFIKDAKVDSPTCKEVPAISHEDIVFMKQIEHDSQFTYDELHLFRETIFRNYINQLNKSTSTDDGEPEVFELISPDSPDSQPKVAKTGVNISENGLSQSAQCNVSAQSPSKNEPNVSNMSGTPPSGGWYGWLAGWFAKESSSEETPMEDSDANDGFLMDMWQATGGKHPLPPDLRNIEKRMEEEIIDVLNESWDDSTVLRRDNLLAELVLRLDRLIVRFLDEGTAGPTTSAYCPSRVLALDMRRVASRVQLAPREHRTEICLSVGEMSVQRLQFPFDTSLGAASAKHAERSTIHDNRSEADGDLVFLDPFSLSLQNTANRMSPTSQMTADDDEEEESLLYGFRATDLILNNTQLMLTVGRANDMIMFGDSGRPSIYDKKNRRKSLTSRMRSSSMNDSNIPMLKLFYKRLAPKLDVFHDLDIQMAPISAMYDEGALDGLFDMFGTGFETQDQEKAGDDTINEIRNDIKANAEESVVNSKLFLSLSVPWVTAELRSRKSALLNPNITGIVPTMPHNSNSASTPFALAILEGLDVSLINSERFLSKLKLSFQSICLDDLFEANTKWPLLKSASVNGDNDTNWPVSTTGIVNSSFWPSCPNLTQLENPAASSLSAPHQQQLSCSVPDKLQFEPAFSPEKMHQVTTRTLTDKTSIIGNGQENGQKQTISLVFVDSRHPHFENVYNEQHCSVEADFHSNELEIGMNRRSWVMLLDFLGMLGGGKSKTENDPPTASRSHQSNPGNHRPTTEHSASKTESKLPGTQAPSYNFSCKVHSKVARVEMNYPAADSTQLGECRLIDADFFLQMDLNNFEEPMRMKLCGAELRLFDATPFYSQLYDERLTIQPKKSGTTVTGLINPIEAPKINLEILKHRLDDERLKRDFDVKIRLEVGPEFHSSYVHTHRYFCAFLEFWMNFAELQYEVFKQNESLSDIKSDPNACQKTRCLLDISFKSGAEFVIPLNQLCDEVILVNATQMTISNCFKRASQFPSLEEHAIAQCGDMGDYDCLLDAMRVNLNGVSIKRALRVPSSRVLQPTNSTPIFHNFIFHSIPSGTAIHANNDNILSRDFDFHIDVYRNLSSLFSHGVPDLAVVTSLNGIELCFTTQFYCLLRGILDQNLGELLIPQPDTIPIELLQFPERTYATENELSKYATLSFRMLLSNVQFNFLTPKKSYTNQFEKFARMALQKAKMSYDSYVDDQAEFDLICESTTLVDSRFEDESDMHIKPNVFTQVVSARQTLPPDTCSPNSSPVKSLMCEAHIMMRKDEAPVVTLVLMHARVLLLLDWLTNANEFILLNTCFVPPSDPAATRSASELCTYEAPKQGVLTRAMSVINDKGQHNRQHSQILHSTPIHTVTLKITLKESDLVLLEDPTSPDSLALICYTTAVVTANDASGQMEASYEIQRLNLCWCIMSSEQSTKCLLTNDFSATIQVARDQSVSLSHQVTNQVQKNVSPNSGRLSSGVCPHSGIHNIEILYHRQRLSLELSDEVIARCCYRDFLVLRKVIRATMKRFHESPAPLVEPVHSLSSTPTQTTISKVCVKADRICLWLLDDSQGVAIPMIRLAVSKLALEKSLDRLHCHFTLGADYFNQRVFGWEPLVEPWLIDRLAIQWRENHVNVDLTPHRDSSFEINLTQTFIQQMNQLSSRWTTIHKSLLEEDNEESLKHMYTRSKADHLPYILRNETGSPLKFTTSVDELTRSRADNRKSVAKWLTVAPAKSCTFEFPTRLLTLRENSDESRVIVVRVDGWDEITPVNVDSVGTYFRVVRMSPSMQKSPTVSHFARVVIVISMEPDGRKVCTVQSALMLSNRLADSILIKLDNSRITHPDDKLELELSPSTKICIPLKYVNAEMEILPRSNRWKAVGMQHVDWLSTSGTNPYTRAANEDSSEGFTRRRAPPPEYRNRLFKFPVYSGSRERSNEFYWMCVSIKREQYPELSENEMLSGHTISFIAPFTILNLLPIEVEFQCGNAQSNNGAKNTIMTKYSVQAGKQLMINGVNLDEELVFAVGSDRFNTEKPSTILRSQISRRALRGETRPIKMCMRDTKNRPLDLYGSVGIGQGGSLHLSLWVPFWMVNRCGLPLLVKQEAADYDGAGQFDEHEKAKDRNPLMFSFSDDGCPNQCCARLGTRFMESTTTSSSLNSGYVPQYSRSISLSPGVQALKLVLRHRQQPTITYNIGVEVRQGTGRYKDTQVVLFTPRYRLNNQASDKLFVCHKSDISNSAQHMQIDSKSNAIWHDNISEDRMVCVRREDIQHWSRPFRIDQIGSFHVTMRDRDDTPQFVRVEITLSNASFWITFSDACYFPAPIRIENRSDVPVLYHQHYNAVQQNVTDSSFSHPFRTICKAHSDVDYAWDDLYSAKLLTLQAYENKSNSYDPARPGQYKALIYENYFYIQYASSFERARNSRSRLPSISSTSTGSSTSSYTDDHELVLVALKEGKVVLGKLDITDSAKRQLWRHSEDGCLENIGMNNQAREGERYVLDILDTNRLQKPSAFEDGSNPIMMQKFNSARYDKQKWFFTKDGRLKSALPYRYVEARGLVVYLCPPEKQSSTQYYPDAGEETIKSSQWFRRQSHRPGSGVLDVQCLHVGPTLVVRITDRADQNKTLEKKLSNTGVSKPDHHGLLITHEEMGLNAQKKQPQLSFNVTLDMRAGIGVSLINNSHEELIYLRFRGVTMHVLKHEGTYQFSGNVDTVQADNQMLNTERWQLLYCDSLSMGGGRHGDSDTPDLVRTASVDGHVYEKGLPAKPALSIELNCTPMEHYDAFDSFRIKLCDLCVVLDEMLLWKIIQFVQETGTAHSVQPKALLQPPNIEPDTCKKNQAANPTRRCYFGTLELEVGNVSLTVTTVGKSTLPTELRRLKEQFNIKLVSFENALVSLPAFRQFHYFETMQFLVESLSKFYLTEFSKQTLNIIVTMDAFGNPLGLATDLKESFQGLLFEGDVGGFVFGLGYGVTNSISKMASSMAQGVGSLTFDEQHEHMRRRMLRSQSALGADNATALSHLYGGVKGLGVGVFGGLTALAKNTISATQKDGVSGILRGVTTGAVDTVTKPLQGALDLLEGTASAFKEAVGGPNVRKSYFPESRIRQPRICTNLQSLLPLYSNELAEAQQELLRINSYSTNELLLDVIIIFVQLNARRERIYHRALICSDQCFILSQTGDESSTVNQRIAYKYLKNIYPTTGAGSDPKRRLQLPPGVVSVEVLYSNNSSALTRRQNNQPSSLLCMNRDIAMRLCDMILRAKQLYDHSRRTLTAEQPDDDDLLDYGH